MLKTRLEKDSFVAKGTMYRQPSSFLLSYKRVPSVGQIVTWSDPNKVLMSMLEHFIEAGLSHLQALLEQVFTGGLGVAPRKLRGVICAQGFLNTLEGGSSLLNHAFTGKWLAVDLCKRHLKSCPPQSRHVNS
jgi:hypothetical protein